MGYERNVPNVMEQGAKLKHNAELVKALVSSELKYKKKYTFHKV